MLIFADLDRLHHRYCALLTSELPTEDGGLVKGELKPTADEGRELVGFESGGDGDGVAGSVAGVVTVGGEGEPVVYLLSGLVLAVNRPGRVELMLVNDDGCELGLYT